MALASKVMRDTRYLMRDRKAWVLGYGFGH